jgi:hypothetical protein
MTIPPMLDHAPAILVTVCEAVVLLAGRRSITKPGRTLQAHRTSRTTVIAWIIRVLRVTKES